MDAAGYGLGGPMANLARMLAIVDFEHEEDKRVRLQPQPGAAHVNLREATKRAVEEAGAPAAPTDDDQPETPAGTPLAARWPTAETETAPATTIAFKSFNGEPTATFPNRTCAGRVACFSTRDGHCHAPVADVDRWPNAPNPPGNC